LVGHDALIFCEPNDGRKRFADAATARLLEGEAEQRADRLLTGAAERRQGADVMQRIATAMVGYLVTSSCSS
jgi:hypothetical protein